MAAAVTHTDRQRTIPAIVYLADGEECRCLQVPPSATVGDLIAHMMQIQEDWNELGGSGERKIAMRSVEDSTTDTEEHHFAIVESHVDANGVPVERIVSRDLRLDADELKEARSEWQRIVLQHMAAKFLKTKENSPGKWGARGKKGKKIAAKMEAQRKAKEGKASDAITITTPETTSMSYTSSGNTRTRTTTMTSTTIITSGLDEHGNARPAQPQKKSSHNTAYWFIGPKARKVQRLKFVNMDDYQVVRTKEGWLDVKIGRQVKSRWVVFSENTVRVFKDSDSEDVPVIQIHDVDKCEFFVKPGKKGKFKIKLRRGKDKATLICENDIMAERWYEALRQGSSGAIKKTAASRGGIQLKLGKAVEVIPEYTEEEEEEDLQRAAQASGYLTVDAMVAMAGDKTGRVASNKLTQLPQDGGYLSSQEISQLLINEDGDYLTLDTMRELCENAGYMTVADMQGLANASGDYLTVTQMQEICRDAGYLTLDEMNRLYQEDTSEGLDMSLDEMNSLFPEESGRAQGGPDVSHLVSQLP